MNVEVLAVAGVIFLFCLAAGVIVIVDVRAWRSEERDRGFEVLPDDTARAKEEPR